MKPTHEIPAYQVQAVQWKEGMEHPLVTKDDDGFCFITVTIETDSTYGSYQIMPKIKMMHDQHWIVIHADETVEILSDLAMQQRYTAIKEDT